jgi:predicted O-methyltransferase YrrM
MSLKSILKEILPAPVLAYASAVEQQVKLAAIAPAELLPDSLKPSNDFILPRIMGDADALASWETDRVEIENIYPAHATYAGVSPGDRRALYTLVRALKPASVLEIGTHIGSTTLHLARALKTNGGGHLTTVDTYDVNDPVNGSWKKYGFPLSVQQTLEQTDLADRVTFRTDSVINFLNKTDLNFDMIFLGGEHSAAANYNEVSAALRRLSPDGVIILHDYYPDGKSLFPGEPPVYGPYLGMRRVMSEHKSVHVVPLGDLPWPTKADSHKTSLAVVLKHPVA